MYPRTCPSAAIADQRHFPSVKHTVSFPNVRVSQAPILRLLKALIISPASILNLLYLGGSGSPQLSCLAQAESAGHYPLQRL